MKRGCRNDGDDAAVDRRLGALRLRWRQSESRIDLAPHLCLTPGNRSAVAIASMTSLGCRLFSLRPPPQTSFSFARWILIADEIYGNERNLAHLFIFTDWTRFDGVTTVASRPGLVSVANARPNQKSSDPIRCLCGKRRLKGICIKTRVTGSAAHTRSRSA